MKTLPTPYLKTVFFLFVFLTSACTIKNREVAGEITTIKNTDWLLLAVGEQDVTVEQNTRTSYIHFEGDNNKVKGFAGCNSFFGRYTLDGNNLKLGELGSTRVSCPSMELENKLMEALSNVTSYSISGELLTLYKGDEAVATFRAAYGRPVDQEAVR